MLSIPKHQRIEMPKLRRSAKVAPHCMGCLVPNLGEIALALAHYNWQDGGKGVGCKVHDALGAILCSQREGCHDRVDGRSGGLSIDERKLLWLTGHVRTMDYWLQEGFLK